LIVTETAEIASLDLLFLTLPETVVDCWAEAEMDIAAPITNKT
jgi:hypothetical protein